MVKNPPANAGNMGLFPALGRAPGEGNGNPLQYCCLRNPMDRGAWQARIHRVAQSWTQLKRLSTHTLIYIVVVVRSLSCVQLFATPWTTTHHVTLTFTISWSLLKHCDSSSPEFSMIYSAYKLNKQGDNIEAWHTSSNLEPVLCSMPRSNWCFLTCIQVSQEAGKVVWYSYLLKNFHSLLWSTQSKNLAQLTKEK